MEHTSVEELWRLTVEHSPVGMTLVSPAGELLMSNRALCSMLGYTEDDLRLRTWHEIVHADDLEADLDLFVQAVEGRRESFRVTKRFLRADGSEMWGDLAVALLRADDGTPRHFISQIIDVTAQRLDQAELRAAMDLIDHQRRMARAILDTVDVGLLLIDKHGHYEEMNRRHHDFIDLAYPDGHRQQAGQLGAVYAADGVSEVGRDDMPSIRAVRGEEFDDYRIWVGDDPMSRRALAVSARTVRGVDGGLDGAALAYSDITDLMQAIRAREDLMAAVSHELRTPLTSVLGHLEILLDRTDLDESAAREIRVAYRNALRLSHLVADLLESAQHRDGRVHLSLGPVDLADLVRDAAPAWFEAARTRGLELEVDVPPSAASYADLDRLRQVADNLVHNAVKYTDPGGSISVTVAVVADTGVRLSVVDTGIGIESDDLARVFVPFFRTRAALDRMTPGVGLGLGIVRTIVEAHRGRLGVESRPGIGSTFTVDLPTRQV